MATVIQSHLENVTAGEAITAPALIRVRASNGLAYNATNADRDNPAQALVLTSISNGAIGQAYWTGIVEWPTSLTPGDTMYLGTSGGITATKPTNAQQIGYVTANGMLALSIKPFEPVAAPTMLTGSATLNFGTVDEEGSISTLTISVTGAAAGDVVIVQYPSGSLVGYIHFSAYVSATNTVSVVCHNDSPFAVNVPSGTFKVIVFK